MYELPEIVSVPLAQDNVALVHYENQCYFCSSCKWACIDQMSVLGHYSIERNKSLCLYCGQCLSACPSFAMDERLHYPAVRDAIGATDKIVVASVSPAVRTALGEAFGMPEGSFVQGKLVALLKALGFDYVLDTALAADLTALEESEEFVRRIKNGGPFPMFTSCCPAWVRFAELFYPQLLPNLSTCKSPIGMQGPTVKLWLNKKKNLPPDRIVNVAITPCTAKKYEITLPSMTSAAAALNADGIRDMDYVVTTRELAAWADEAGIEFDKLENAEFDSLLGDASGAGIIFGTTGGVTEATVRTVFHKLTGQDPPTELLKFDVVRRKEDTLREAVFAVGEKKLRAALICGTANVRRFLDTSDLSKYHIIEVMACPGGCVGGGGQPKGYTERGDIPVSGRMEGLRKRDSALTVRTSCENIAAVNLHRELYGAVGSETSEAILHTSYTDRSNLI